MSYTHPSASTSSNFHLIFDNALEAYKNRLKKDVLTHPLAAQLQDCHSPASILDLLQQQVEELNHSRQRNERWTRWLRPTVKVLHAFSKMLGQVTLGFPPARAIFTAIGVLFSAAKNVRGSQDALFEIFERLEAFFQRLEIYTEIPLDRRMVDTVARIMAEVLNVLAIATKEIHQGRMKRYLKKLIRNRTDMEDALKRLDRLTNEEAQMAAAQVMKVTYSTVDTGGVRGGADIMLGVDNRAAYVRTSHALHSESAHDLLDPPAPAHSYMPTTTRPRTHSTSTPHHDLSDIMLGVDNRVAGVRTSRALHSKTAYDLPSWARTTQSRAHSTSTPRHNLLLASY